MSAFLRRLRARNVQLSAHDGRLRVSAPKGALTNELRAEIAARKRELLEALGATHGDDGEHSGPRRMPVAWAQRRFWFLHQLAPQSPFYNLFAAARLRGRLDVEALRKALTLLVRRHEALRVTLSAGADGDVQAHIHDPVPVEVPLIDVDPASLEGVLAQEKSRPMGPETLPMLRATLLRLGAEEHVLTLTTHHFACDGWSWHILFRDIAELYHGLVHDLPPPPLPKAQYADYSHWQEQYLDSDEAAAALDYWRGQLAPPLPQLDLPTDRPRPPIFTTRGAAVSFALPTELSEAVEQLAKNEQCTPFTILLAAWFATLGIYTEQNDIIVGVPVSVRPFPEASAIVGALTNALPVRARVRVERTFRELVQSVKQRLFSAIARQDLPFDLMVREIAFERDPSRMPVIETMFNWLNTPQAEIPFSSELSLELVPVQAATARFDISVDMSPWEGSYRGRIEYRTDLFESTTIESIAAQFFDLLANGIDAPDRAIRSLNMRRDESPVDALGVSSAGCLHELVDASAARFGDRIAVEEASLATWTYEALRSKSAVIARGLAARGVGRGARVAIVLEAGGIDLIAAILAVLRVGAAYVPIEPTVPGARIASLVKDCGAQLVIGDAPHELAIPVAQLEHDTPPSVVLPKVHEDDPAYVIYTSGSTGAPKGVVVPHRGVALMTREIVATFAIGPGDRVAQFVSPAFDVAVSEIFMALAAGATLCLLRAEERIPGPELVALLRRRRITLLSAPASVFSVLPPSNLPELRAVIAGGETASSAAADRWAEGRVMYLAYGPTETSVCATHGPYENGRVRSLGRPLGHASVHVLSSHLDRAAPGMAGELYIGGAGVAQAYLDRPEATAAAFVPNPFSGVAGDRMYRSGDRGKRMLDGTLEFLGRRDDQVKVRGHRIELGEIEAALRSAPGVHDAVVACRRDAAATLSLHGYVVLQGGASDEERIRQHLQTRLPAYMIPSTLALCDELPRTSTGKIDRRALAALTPPAARAPALEDPLERAIAGKWQELLGSEPRSRDANFFESGGHSLLAVRLLRDIGTEFGVELPTTTIYACPSIATLAAAVRRAREGHSAANPVALARGPSAPLFLVHGIDGSVGCFREVASLWQGRRSVFAFAARGLAAGEQAQASVVEAAAEYAEAILASHEGDFVLGGWSFGGLVAAEMTRLLAERGRAPQHLLLLDSNPLAADELARFDDESLRPIFDERVAGMRAEASDALVIDRAYAVFRAHVQAQRDYRLGHVDVPTTLMQADSSDIAERSRARWRDVVRAELRVHPVRGSHESMLRGEGAIAIVETFEQEISRKGNSRTRG